MTYENLMVDEKDAQILFDALTDLDSRTNGSLEEIQDLIKSVKVIKLNFKLYALRDKERSLDFECKVKVCYTMYDDLNDMDDTDRIDEVSDELHDVGEQIEKLEMELAELE